MNTVRFISFITRATVVIVLIVIASGVVAALVSTKPTVEVTVGEKSLTAVVVMEAAAVQVKRKTIGYGVADALQHADVPSQLSATVVVVPPSTRVGRQVRAGDLLVELNDVDFQQQVIRAEQAYSSAKSEQNVLLIEREAAEERALLAIEDQKLAEVELSRVQEAFDRGAAKQREVDTAHQKMISVSSSAVNAKEAADRLPSREEQAASTVTSRGADLELARENLRRCKITSPIDGVIQSIDVRVGEFVQNGVRVARIVHSGSLEIPLRLPSYARSYVMIGDRVSLYSAGFGTRNWDTRVSRIAPEDDTQTRTMIVYVDYEQDPTGLYRIPPGLFVRGEIEDAHDLRPRWVIPRRALRDGRILVIRDSILRSIPVEIEFSVTGDFEQFHLPDKDWAVLGSPLSQGDLVVVDPGGSLRDGMSVRAILANEVSLE